MNLKHTNNSISYYDVLRVSPRASQDDIKRAYRRLAMRYHPDHNPQEEKRAALRFQMINEAYAHLKTKDKRERYNQTLKMGNVHQAQPARYAKNDNQDRSWLSQLATTFIRRKNTKSGTTS